MDPPAVERVDAPSVALRPRWFWAAFAAVSMAIPLAGFFLRPGVVTAEQIGGVLAKVNAALNFTSLVLLLLGYREIRGALAASSASDAGASRRRAEHIASHERFMKLAFLTSATFLVSYLTRFALTGSHRFQGTGPLKTVYLVILFSHMVLAATVVPLVLRTLWLSHKKRFADHRKIARYTFPIWLYVSVTGVIVYVLLYHVGPLVAAPLP